ncbi:MAG: single-stranded DNA-binding protein [Clostridia bacterium]
MLNNYSENNIVKIGGTIASELQISHEVYGEKFYIFDISVSRLSGADDKIPVIVSERLIDLATFKPGLLIEIEGQFRSYNKYREEKSKLVLSIFIKELRTIEVEEEAKTKNEALLNGFVCKKPVYRKTPLGREIADVLIAVNRAYNKSDYIPCIMWGRNAKFCENLPVGTNIKIEGRVQSREYEKKYEDGTVVKNLAYEVSVSKLELLDKEEKEEQAEQE